MHRSKLIFCTVLLLTVSLFLWNCSSHKTPKTTSPDPSLAPEAAKALNEAELKPDTPDNQPRIELAPVPEVTPEEPSQTVEEQPDPELVLEEALNAYQEALIAWDQGDLENAILALDEAYRLILNCDLPLDSPLIQEKNDLRLLIAQRIQEVYASQATAIGENHGSIPLEINKHVQAELKSFQTTEKKLFEDSFYRSGLYMDMILEELRKEGMPEELAWMPMIESWFKVRAYSRARALGLWQFIASTGYRYGLKRDNYVDERMDPEKATKAAVKYLKVLHSMFGDWTTALAGYNCGEVRVRRVINAQRIQYMDNFWDLYEMLPRETRRFVPRFIATLLIVNDPDKYNMNLPVPAASMRYDTITTKKPLKLSSLSQKLGLAAEAIADMNPELRHKSTPDREYQLKIPVGRGEQALASVNALPRWVPPEATYVTHIVRRGETVSKIASRYRTSISAIGRMNNLGRRYLIRPGQRLKVPTRYGSSYASVQSLELSKQGDKMVYTVKRGDSLYRIARAFNTTTQNLMRRNNLKNDKLLVGQKLVIAAGAPDGATYYTVKSGDTPSRIAQRHGMSLSLFMSLNGLNNRSKIYPGQRLWVTKK